MTMYDQAAGSEVRVIKSYVRNAREMHKPGQQSKVIIECDPYPENAMVWNTKEEAEHACRSFGSLDLSVEGYEPKNFRVEETSVSQFVVVCDCIPG